jgi:hypothetical protein
MSVLIKGVAYWASICGKPKPGYNNGPDEWSLDLSVDKETVARLTELGLKKKIKNKDDARGQFITFKRKAIKKDRETGKEVPNNPIRIVDHRGEPWPQDKLIGNGSTLNVRFNVNTRPGFQGGPATQAADILSVQVWDHKPYEGKGAEFPTKTDGVEVQTESEEKW